MRISMQWLADYVTLPDAVRPEDVARELTLRTVEVEDVVRPGPDVIFEIDNKSLSNRPDLWGHYGVARELAVIYRVPLAPLPRGRRPPATTGLVGDLDEAVCSRLAAIAYTMDGPTPDTPLWILERLAAIGEDSRGLHADLSAYVMFAVGQPVHGYDADDAPLPLGVTPAGLDDILADPVPPDRVRNVVLAAATLSPGPVRRATKRLGLRTEASARYDKGLDTQRVDQAVDLLLHLLAEAAPGARVHGLQDEVRRPTEPARIGLTYEFLRRRIGSEIPAVDVRGILTGLGFTVTATGAGIELTAPTWRSTGDVCLPHDIVEEVARIIGYDALPVSPLAVPLRPVRSLNQRPVERVVRERLAGLRLREVLTYPWAPDGLLAATGSGKAGTVRFHGAPAPDRDSLRPSLVPNLIEAAAANLRHRDQVAIFEVGTVFSAAPLAPYRGVFEPLPPQSSRVAALMSGVDGRHVFLRLKGVLESIVDCGFAAGGHPGWADASARAVVTSGGQPAGTLGLLTRRLRRLVGLDAVQVACFELDLERVAPLDTGTVEAPSELPEADFDLSVVVADAVPWAAIAAVARAADPLVHRVAFLDEFRGSWVPAGHRSVSLRVTLRPTGATLSADALAAARTGVLRMLGDEVGARLRQ